MEKLYHQIQKYTPFNEQESIDQQVLLHALETQQDVFERKNKFMHFSTSCWIVNPTHDKALMIYHKIYDSWSWLGGHADGNPNLLEVAIKEMQEESGVTNYHLVSEEPFSLEVLTVDGHIKKGKYVNSHLHLNVTYLFEVNETEKLVKNDVETNGVKWINIDDIEHEVSEVWFKNNIYQKLIDKLKGEHL